LADRIEDIRNLLAVVDEGGITAAATHLGVAKSAVSRRLSDLEARLGVALVERSGRALKVTAMGLDYAEKARTIVTSLDALDSLVSVPLPIRRISIEAERVLITHLLIPALAPIIGALPPIAFVSGQGVAADIRISAGAEAEADIRLEDRNDRVGSVRSLSLTTIVTCAAPAYLAGRPHFQRTADLAGHLTIAIDDPTVSPSSRGDGRRPEPSLSVPDANAALAAALAGLGIAMIPDYVAASGIADGRLIRLLERQQPAPARISAFFDDDASRPVREVVDALAGALG
jgi:DNA-binding transcriptional LysR family regulator